MASIQRRKDASGKSRYRLQFYDLENRRYSISLGRVSNQVATEIASHIDSLIDSARYKTQVPARTSAWLDGEAATEVIELLARAKLCESRQHSGLSRFIDQYIESRADASANTIRNYKNSRQKLAEFFGTDRALNSIREGDADDWRQWLVNQKYSESTISKAVKHAKHFFSLAERKGLVRSNPFQHLKAGGEHNEARKAFVPRETIDRVIEHAPHIQWKLIIALARYGGLRCPSEIMELRWDDIDWSAGTITVSSPKTKRLGKSQRVIPLFPELKPLLKQARRESTKKSSHVITRYRKANANLRTQFLRILKSANVTPWERLFQNLRASRETELAGRHPLHVVTAWMGNSELVASRHYLQVTEEDFAAARGAKTSAIGANLVRKVAPHREASSGTERQESPTRKELTSQVFVSLAFAENPQVPPRGVEPLSSD